MKLVKKGEDKFKGWVGARVVCADPNKPDDIYEFEPSDAAKVQQNKTERESGQILTEYYVICPTCDKKILLVRDRASAILRHT